jgi:hypothetical protein
VRPSPPRCFGIGRLARSHPMLRVGPRAMRRFTSSEAAGHRSAGVTVGQVANAALRADYRSGGLVGIASAIAMCPSKSSDVARAR